MPLSENIQSEIEVHLCTWIDKLLSRKKIDMIEFTNEDKAKAKPFHEMLLSKLFVQMADFERSFSTTMGNAFEGCAEIIAKARFSKVTSQHKLIGEVRKETNSKIDGVTTILYQGNVYSDYKKVVKNIVGFSRTDNSEIETKEVISDLYIQDEKGNEMFFEMKSPKPNKEQCINITRKHLWIHTIRKKVHPQVQTYFGMAYNPYGEGNEYKHTFAVSHIDIKNQTLIGRQF